MVQKVRVGAVSYLNTKPLIYGFEQGRMEDEINLLIDYPAKIASLLINDEIDVCLVPVAIIPFLTEYHIISDYCIACDSEVASVCLFSDVPLSQIETIILDYQSRTSVALLKILLANHWKIKPILIAGTEMYEKDINGTIAGLVIGDRAFKQRQHSKFIYDLGTAWKEMTGLPFVFAMWVSNRKLSEKFMSDFNTANEAGLNDLENVIRLAGDSPYDLHTYYTKNISYYFDDSKKEGLQLFLKYIRNDRA